MDAQINASFNPLPNWVYAQTFEIASLCSPNTPLQGLNKPLPLLISQRGKQTEQTEVISVVSQVLSENFLGFFLIEQKLDTKDIEGDLHP